MYVLVNLPWALHDVFGVVLLLQLDDLSSDDIISRVTGVQLKKTVYLHTFEAHVQCSFMEQ